MVILASLDSISFALHRCGTDLRVTTLSVSGFGDRSLAYSATALLDVCISDLGLPASLW